MNKKKSKQYKNRLVVLELENKILFLSMKRLSQE